MKRRKPTIGILVANRWQRKQVLRTYLRHAPKGVQLMAFTPGSISRNRKWVRGLQWARRAFRQAWLPLPGVVYNRSYAPGRAAALGTVGRSPVPLFNEVSQFNKLETDAFLREGGLGEHLPPIELFNTSSLQAMLERCGTVILKPVFGHKGQGVYRVALQPDETVQVAQHYTAPFIIAGGLESAVLQLQPQLGSRLYLTQMGLSLQSVEDRSFDVRALVQKTAAGQWTVTSLTSRIARAGCFNTSMCERLALAEEVLRKLYGEEEAVNRLDAIRLLSLQAAGAMEAKGRMHLGELSVDFGIDMDGKPWIIELNGQPQLSLYRELRATREVYRNPLEYARYLLEQKGVPQRTAPHEPTPP